VVRGGGACMRPMAEKRRVKAGRAPIERKRRMYSLCGMGVIAWVRNGNGLT
jgi:hypothetical protein